MKYLVLIILTMIFLAVFSSASINLGINDLNTPQVIFTGHDESGEMLFNGSANSSFYWGIYPWTDYNMPVIKSFGYNQTTPAISYADTKAATGNCPANFVVQNTTTGGVQCVPNFNNTLNQSFFDSRYVNKTGDKMSGDLNMTNHNFLNVADIYTNVLFALVMTTNPTGDKLIQFLDTPNEIRLDRDFGTPSVTVNSMPLRIKTNNQPLYLGTSSSASLFYNGSDMVANPKEVGTGQLVIKGNLSIQDGRFTTGFTIGGEPIDVTIKPEATGIGNVQMYSCRSSSAFTFCGFKGGMYFFPDDAGGDPAIFELGVDNSFSNIAPDQVFHRWNFFTDATNGIDFQATTYMFDPAPSSSLGGNNIVTIGNVLGNDSDGLIYKKSILQIMGEEDLTNPFTTQRGGELQLWTGIGSTTGGNRLGATIYVNNNSLLVFGNRTQSSFRDDGMAWINISSGDASFSRIISKFIQVNGNANVTGNLSIGGNSNITGNEQVNGNMIILGNLSVKRPYGMFVSTQTQTIAATGTAVPVTFNITEDSFQILKSTDNANFTVQQNGDYLIEISAVVTTTSGSNRHIEIWSRKNNINVPRSNTKVEVATSGQEQVIAVPFILDLNTTDTFSIMWASDTTNAQLLWTQNTSYSPSVPSIIMTITKLSETAGTPYSSGGF